jgi:hypothetical protein
MNRSDPRDRLTWEQQREEETREIEQGTPFARDAGDPRWGTGGLRIDERAYRRTPRDPSEPPDMVVERRPSGGPYAGRGPRGYRRSDDRIHENVCEWFTLHGDLDPSDVEVTVRSGEVTLTGTVATRAQKRLAEDIAEAVSGVVEVHNNLRLARSTSEPRARWSDFDGDVPRITHEDG